LQIRNTSAPEFVCKHNSTFLCAVAERASADRYVILAVVDGAFVDMAFNLYESSFRTHGITNFVFVGIGERTCVSLAAASIPCFHYADIVGYDDPSDFDSPGFLRKVYVKVDMIIGVLTAGYTVLLTDVDLVYLKNPMPFLKVYNSI
jgi:Nucleotide-diphospho-sugar transferase